MLLMMPAEIQDNVLSHALTFNWECSRDALFIADCFTGSLVDVNPQAERLTGYSRDELVGKHQSMLHPHEEFNTIREDFKKGVKGTQRIFDGYHVRRNDRTLIPVSIESTPAFEVNGRMYILGIFRDVSPFVEQQQKLEQKRWALDAYAKATHALAQATSSATLIQETCEAITTNSPFALAWVGFADSEAPYKVHIAGAAGQAIGYIKGLNISWSEKDPTGMGPTGRALRTKTVHAVDDILSDPIYEPWRKLAFPYNLNSTITIPFQMHENRWAALVVYSTKWYIFSPIVIEAFTHLAESIAVGLHTLEQTEQLELNRWALQVHAKAIHALARATSSATLLQEICDSITADSPDFLAWVGMAENEAPFRVRVAGASGQNKHYLDDLEIHWAENDPLGLGPTGVALRTNTVQAAEDTLNDPRFKPWLKQVLAAKMHSCIAVPFVLDENRRAVLTVYSSRWLSFAPVVIDAFKHLAEGIAVGLHTLEQAECLNAERAMREIAQEELTRTFESVGKAIVKTLALHDPYTAGHQDRVAELSRAIAEEMGLEHELVQAIGMAAFLHDIGKISTPVNILNKPARLTEDEINIVREHTQDGYDILKNVPFHFPVAEMVYQHHERLDGSGYPRGLHGDQIHIGARIIAVADTVESMASPRSYRPSMGMERAIKQIESQSGKTLDEQIVQTCLLLFREKGYTLPQVLSL
jgi:PAS domain S-box-containing protein/putative nucleotidyltransferase with HDIG domain